MTAKTSAWLVMVAIAIGACDIAADDDWDDDGWHQGEHWGAEPPPRPAESPSQSSAPTPTYPARDAAVPLGPSAAPTALAPAIAWRTGDAAIQQVAFAGLFPDAFTLQTSGLRPPTAALTPLTDQPNGGHFAYGDIVALRPGTEARSCSTAACPTLPCTNAAPACGSTQCADIACPRVCGSSPCPTPCGVLTPDAGCTGAAAPPTIEGVVAGYVVIYSEREIAAGTRLAGIFNDYRSLAPGVHLIRTDVLTPDQTEQAASCRRAASERAVERYNELEHSSYADDTELRSALGLRVTLGEPGAAECALRYERFVQTSHVEQRCRFELLAAVIDPLASCVLRVSFGAPLPPSLLP